MTREFKYKSTDVVPVRIVCSAVILSNDKMLVGVRHFDNIMRDQLTHEDMEYINGSKQGFLTNKFEFVTREEAWVIAKEQGQLLRETGSEGLEQLFSENLY